MARTLHATITDLRVEVERLTTENRYTTTQNRLLEREIARLTAENDELHTIIDSMEAFLGEHGFADRVFLTERSEGTDTDG